MKNEHKGILVVIALIVLLIIGISDCGSNTTPSADTSSVPSASAGAPSASAGLPSASAEAPSSSAADAPSSVLGNSPTVATSSPPPPQTTAPAAPAHCYPISNEGTCYEPGEFCRKVDHGASGLAGDGKRIVCEDNDGWRWEPV
jgi:hypothetical protein